MKPVPMALGNNDDREAGSSSALLTASLLSSSLLITRQTASHLASGNEMHVRLANIC